MTMKYFFVSKHSPSFTIKRRIGRETQNVQFKDSVFQTNDDVTAEWIRKQIEINAGVSQNVQEVDIKHAEEISRKIQQMQKGAGHKGASTSTSVLSQLSNAVLDDRDAQMRAEGVSEGEIERLRDGYEAEGLALTHDAKNDPPVKNDDLKPVPEGSPGPVLTNTLSPLEAALKKASSAPVEGK